MVVNFAHHESYMQLIFNVLQITLITGVSGILLCGGLCSRME